MHRGQHRKMSDTGFIKGQTGNQMPCTLGRKITLGRVRQRQFAQTMLYDDFPERSNAQIYLIARITHAVAPVRRQPRVPADEPEEHVCIEQESHWLSNVLKMLSGKGASKSSGTVNSPAHSPKGRNFPTPEAIDLTSATGYPARTIISVSPSSTRFRYAERSRCMSSTLTLTWAIVRIILRKFVLSRPFLICGSYIAEKRHIGKKEGESLR